MGRENSQSGGYVCREHVLQGGVVSHELYNRTTEGSCMVCRERCESRQCGVVPAEYGRVGRWL